ncbi:MAG: hypothetical protein IKS17_07205 [Firmicutes bacterium]|nr:hypothetical protein [Bacillota bacterium]
MEKKKVLRVISYIGVVLLAILLLALLGRGAYSLYTTHKMKTLPTKHFKFTTADTELVTLHDSFIIGGTRYYPEIKGGANYYAANEAERDKLNEYWGKIDNRVTVDPVRVEGIINILNGLDLGKIEQDKNTDKIHDRESFAGKCVWVTVQIPSKSYNMHIFDRYIYIYTPWDEVETVYYIQNFDKENIPEDLIMSIAGEK